MKRLAFLLIPAMIFASCGNGGKKTAGTDSGKPDSAKVKVIPVAVTPLQITDFNAFVEVQSQVAGDENVLASSQAPGIIKTISARVGQKVGKGQVLATLDANTVELQIEAQAPQLALLKSIYERQQNLWAQNIGTEVGLMTAKTNYEGVQKQIAALKSQRDLYRVVSPISGVVDAVNMKIGEMCQPGSPLSGIRIVNRDKLKAEATLGENYLGKIKQGDRVMLILPDGNDTIRTSLSYVAQAIDPASRSFTVTVQLGNSPKLHPNMACTMRIINYENKNALVVPVSVIQKTSTGDMLYVADGDKAKSVTVTVGRNANGMVEILSGLKVGDRVITKGYEEMDNGQQIAIQ